MFWPTKRQRQWHLENSFKEQSKRLIIFLTLGNNHLNTLIGILQKNSHSLGWIFWCQKVYIANISELAALARKVLKVCNSVIYTLHYPNHKTNQKLTFARLLPIPCNWRKDHCVILRVTIQALIAAGAGRPWHPASLRDHCVSSDQHSALSWKG